MQATSNPFDLDTKRAFVAGGLGLLGSAIAIALARAGAEVVVLDCSDESWERVGAEASHDDCTLTYAAFDVTELENPVERLEELESKLGPADIWVNASYPRTSDWTQISSIPTSETWRQNIDMHLSSYCLWSEFFAAKMASRRQGSIVNVASIYGMVAPDPALYVDLEMTTPSAYSAIKGGIIAHTKHLAARYGRQGVRVNAVSPGGIANRQPAVFTERYDAKTMIGRMAEAEEIAWPTVFLCSDAASYITGTNLVVDAGLTAL